MKRKVKRKAVNRSANRKLTRQQQYESILWKAKREEIFKRDNYKCQHKSCNHQEGESYEICCHHKKYNVRGMLWEVPDTALITWCTAVHSRHHGRNLSRNLTKKKKPPLS
jgi:hypothetical protein